MITVLEMRVPLLFCKFVSLVGERVRLGLEEKADFVSQIAVSPLGRLSRQVLLANVAAQTV